MAPSENPYEALRTEKNKPDTAPSGIRRPRFGTFLIAAWLLEGGFKTYLLGSGFVAGFNPIPFIVREYQQTSLWLFLVISSFLIIETVGPWVGIYYLTGKRARTIPFETALYRTLKVSGTFAIAIAFILILYCHVVGG